MPTTKYYSIRISYTNLGVIFNGYIKVVDITITNFYYVNSSPQYVDILLTNNGGHYGDYGLDNKFLRQSKAVFDNRRFARTCGFVRATFHFIDSGVVLGRVV